MLFEKIKYFIGARRRRQDDNQVKMLTIGCQIAATNLSFARDAVTTTLFVGPDTPRFDCENCVKRVRYDSSEYCPDADHSLDILVPEHCSHFSEKHACDQVNCEHYAANQKLIQAKQEYDAACRAYRNFTGKKWRGTHGK